ncbi:MAG: molybdenum cofactor guanylyltransferase MobA [Tabrizicola sp.]|nr:molybdenum cofactor guanylyltransferase MobA [Paracoccaceae bacterium]MDZ4067251.1 molybdenum cofactor guanylyltransferase MobA [Tabrizicola sp.]
MRIFGVILAGGQARRMGGADKALVPLAGKPLIAHVVERFAPQVEALAISANGDAARFHRFGLPVIPDADRLGPLSGILGALDWAAAAGATAVVSVPVDAPFLPGDLVPQLVLAGGDGAAIAGAYGRAHPVFGLWPVEVRSRLAAFLASGAKPKVLDFCAQVAAARADFVDETAFLNVNTPEDLARAEALIGGQR